LADRCDDPRRGDASGGADDEKAQESGDRSVEKRNAYAEGYNAPVSTFGLSAQLA